MSTRTFSTIDNCNMHVPCTNTGGYFVCACNVLLATRAAAGLWFDATRAVLVTLTTAIVRVPSGQLQLVVCVRAQRVFVVVSGALWTRAISTCMACMLVAGATT